MADSKITLTEPLGNALAVETIVVDPSEYQRPEPEQGERVIASTTDSWEALETGQPVTLEKSSLANYKEIDSGTGTKIDSYEPPDSSRHRAEDSFAEYEQALNELRFPEDQETIEQLAAEADVQLEPETPEASPQQPPSVPYDQVAAVVENQIILREHAARVQRALEDPEYAEFVSRIPPVDVPWSPAIGAAVCAQSNSPVLVAFLSARPDLAQEIASLPVAKGLAEVAKLSAWLQTQLTAPAAAPAPRRAVSNAPAPIRPVGGSSTKSAVPPDSMDFQSYKRWRDAGKKKALREGGR